MYRDVYNTDGLEERVAATLTTMAGYVAVKDKKYKDRALLRRVNKFPVLSFTGMGRSGKDTAAELLNEELQQVKFRHNFKPTYAGSTSKSVLPFMSHTLKMNEEVLFNERHEHRRFWIDYCIMLRKNDPTLLARMLLAESDYLVGLREKIEITSVIDARVAAVHIWIERPGTPVDETVLFEAADCPLRLLNDKGLEEFRAKIKLLVPLFGF